MTKHGLVITFKKLRIALVALLTLTSLATFALNSNYYASTSRLATGKWMKIRISKQGIQQITYAQLREWGFANPEAVKVYGFGGTALCDHSFGTSMPDDIQPTLSVHTSDERIMFYGEAEARVRLSGLSSVYGYKSSVDRNYSSNSAYYLITDAEVGGTVAGSAAYSSQNATIDTHYCVQLFERESVAPGNGGCIFHTQEYSPGDAIKVPFAIKDYAGGDSYRGSVTFELAVNNALSDGKSSSASYNIPYVSCEDDAIQMIKSNTNKYSVRAISSMYAYLTCENRNAFSLDEGSTIADGTYTFYTNTPMWSDTQNSTISYMALDRAVLCYPRKNVLHKGDGALIMHFASASASDNFVIEGADENTLVWNITNPTNVFDHKGYYNAEKCTFAGSFDKDYLVSSAYSDECCLIAFNPTEQYNAVEAAGEVANQNIHGDETPDMVIVTTDELLSYAQELAELHRSHDGMSVNVYTQQQIFNEFGAGNPSPMAVRRALKMFYDRDKTKLKHLLMYGAALYDFRQIIEHTSYEPLITFEVEPINAIMQTAASYSYINFASDNYFAFLDDTDTPDVILTKDATVNLCVGRIPAISEVYAHDVNAKIKDYMANPLPAEVTMRAMLISDTGNSNRHLDQSIDMGNIMTASRQAMTMIQTHNLIYPHTSSDAPAMRRACINALKQGVGLYCYNGHGSSRSIGSSGNIWNINNAENTDYEHAPLAMIASCATVKFDGTGSGLVNSMLRNNNGGAIGAIAAGRVVYLEDNQYVSEAVAQAYSAATGKTAIGEIYRTAHNLANVAIGGTSTDETAKKSHINLMCYAFIGDPAVTINMPENSVTITAINNEDASAAVAIAARNKVNIKAQVTDASDSKLSGFNGTAIVTVYEAPHTVNTVIVNTGSDGDKAEEVTLDEDVLVSTTVKVIDGEIDATMYVPTNAYASSADNCNRITVVATATDGSVAVGANRVAYISDAVADGEFDGSLPEITELYVDDSKAHAVISLGEAGLSLSNSLGNSAMLSIDGTSVTNYMLPIVVNADGTATLQYDITGVAEGVHTLTLSIADYAGNHVERSTQFAVGSFVWLTANKTNVHDDVEFEIEHTYETAPTFILIIENVCGETILRKELNEQTFTWQLKNGKNEAVPDGFYSAYVLATDNSTYRASERVQFVVTH